VSDPLLKNGSIAPVAYLTAGKLYCIQTCGGRHIFSTSAKRGATSSHNVLTA